MRGIKFYQFSLESRIFDDSNSKLHVIGELCIANMYKRLYEKAIMLIP
jgi:hypothetical protein